MNIKLQPLANVETETSIQKRVSQKDKLLGILFIFEAACKNVR